MSICSKEHPGKVCPNIKRSKKKPRWRAMYMEAAKLAVGLIHRNLISAFPEREHVLLKISAVNIFENEIKKKVKP